MISAHSTRRGFVTGAFADGADPLHVARHAGFAPGSKILYRHVDDGYRRREDFQYAKVPTSSRRFGGTRNLGRVNQVINAMEKVEQRKLRKITIATMPARVVG